MAYMYDHDLEEGEYPNSTSEVGWESNDPNYGIVSPVSMFSDQNLSMPAPPPESISNNSDHLKEFLEELVKRLPTQQHRSIKIPAFYPEEENTDAKSWLYTTEICMRDHPCSGSDLIIVLSNAMRGSATKWFARISSPYLTWERFKELFTSFYIIVDTPAATLAEQFRTGPKENETYASYITQFLDTLSAQLQGMTEEEKYVTITLAHLSKYDKRVERIADIHDIRSRDLLLRHVKHFSNKRRLESTADHQHNKKFRFGNRPFCYHCKTRGHLTQDCRRKQRSSSPGPSSSTRRGECFKCQSKDHYANACPRGNTSLTNNQSNGRFGARQVNLCSINPSGSLTHKGELFSFVFDSGSECSILRNKMHEKFSGPTFESPVNLSGIGQSRVISTVQKIAEVIIDGNSLNIYFHVVPDDSINDDIIVGREVLKMGIKIHLTNDTCTFVPDDLNLSKAITNKYNPEINIPTKLTEKVDLTETTHNIQTTCDDNKKVGSSNPWEDILGYPNTNINLAEPNKKVHLIVPQSDNNSYIEKHEPFSSNKIKTEIDETRKPELIGILNKYQNYMTEGLPTTRVTTGEMQIRLIDPSKIVTRRPYPLSPVEKKIVREQIVELEQAKIVRKSKSPYASPIKLVPKKNGKMRLCVDYRLLNANTISQHHPLPLIKDQIDRLASAYYFTTLDMASGYHAIPVHPDSIEKTAFVTPEGQYEYLTMPFGLKNGASVYQASLQAALGPLINECCTAFIDDVMIYAKTVDESLTNLDKVLEALSKAGFTVNIAKCSFVVTKVLFLGFEISAGEIRPNKQKIECLVSLPPPSNVSSLRQFIGLATYFRQFIRDFSKIAEPLYKLLTSKSDLIWLPEHEKARQTLISHLTNEPVLMIFDSNFPVELHTDASSVGYSGILCQIIDNKPRVVAYYSKRTTPAESRYHSYELETLAVYHSIRHFRTYLQYCPFTVVTDCKSLKESYLKQDLIARVHRWWSYMQSFDFKIVYRPANRMQHVDYLSRHPISNEVSVHLTELLENNESYCPDSIESSQISSPADAVSTKAETISQSSQFSPNRNFPILRVNLTTLPDDWLMLAQRQDTEISEMLTKIESDELADDIRNTYEIRSGILCRKIQRNNQTRCLPIVPQAYKWSVVNNIHGAIMHLGFEKTLEKIVEFYWFKNMSKFVRKFVENCLTCKVAKTPSGRTQIELHSIPKTNIPWHTIHIDISGKLSGKNDIREYLIVLIDAFTKYVLLYPTRKIDSENVTKALKNSISLFGSPTKIIADQGRCFASNDFKQFCNKHQIDVHYIATGAPRANGQVERVMSVLTNMLTAIEITERSWQDAVADIQLAINSTINRVTKSSPLELMIGKIGRPLNLVIPTQAITGSQEVDLEKQRKLASTNMIASAIYDKKRFNKGKAKIKPFSVGDLVFIQNEARNQEKLSPKFRGPLKVVEVLENDRYILKSLTSNRTFKYPHDRIRSSPNLFQQEVDYETISEGSDSE